MRTLAAVALGLSPLIVIIVAVALMAKGRRRAAFIAWGSGLALYVVLGVGIAVVRQEW